MNHSGPRSKHTPSRLQKPVTYIETMDVGFEIHTILHKYALFVKCGFFCMLKLVVNIVTISL